MLDNQTNQELLQSYKDALASHDWNYNYSDCPFTYRKGQRTASAIIEAKRKCIQAGLQEQAGEIYNDFMQRKDNARRY